MEPVALRYFVASAAIATTALASIPIRRRRLRYFVASAAIVTPTASPCHNAREERASRRRRRGNRHPADAARPTGRPARRSLVVASAATATLRTWRSAGWSAACAGGVQVRAVRGGAGCSSMQQRRVEVSPRAQAESPGRAGCSTMQQGALGSLRPTTAGVAQLHTTIVDELRALSAARHLPDRDQWVKSMPALQEPGARSPDEQGQVRRR